MEASEQLSAVVPDRCSVAHLERALALRDDNHDVQTLASVAQARRIGEYRRERILQ